METVGERIKHQRKKKNLTQQEFAQMIGDKQNSVSAWERDTRTPTLSKVKQICTTLECTSEEILGF